MSTCETANTASSADPIFQNSTHTAHTQSPSDKVTPQSCLAFKLFCRPRQLLQGSTMHHVGIALVSLVPNALRSCNTLHARQQLCSYWTSQTGTHAQVVRECVGYTYKQGSTAEGKLGAYAFRALVFFLLKCLPHSVTGLDPIRSLQPPFWVAWCLQPCVLQQARYIHVKVWALLPCVQFPIFPFFFIFFWCSSVDICRSLSNFGCRGQDL